MDEVIRYTTVSASHEFSRIASQQEDNLFVKCTITVVFGGNGALVLAPSYFNARENSEPAGMYAIREIVELF